MVWYGLKSSETAISHCYWSLLASLCSSLLSLCGFWCLFMLNVAFFCPQIYKMFLKGVGFVFSFIYLSNPELCCIFNKHLCNDISKMVYFIFLFLFSIHIFKKVSESIWLPHKHLKKEDFLLCITAKKMAAIFKLKNIFLHLALRLYKPRLCSKDNVV